MRAEEPQKQTVHYIWIGEPIRNGSSQDVIGPLQMCDVVDQSTNILFWCLGEHTLYYSDIFFKKKVTIRSIERYLDEKTSDPQSDIANFASALTLLYEKFFSASASTTRGGSRERIIRDRFTFKEAFAFFLLFSKGGYVADTNLLPESHQVEFPRYSTFMMPALKNGPILDHKDVDVWLMYSPPENNTRAQEMLRQYLAEVHRVEERYNGELHNTTVLSNFKRAMLHLVIKSALQLDDGYQHPNFTNFKTWTTKQLGVGWPVKFDEQPRVIKHYNNSHGATDRDAMAPIDHAAVTGNMDKLKELLRENSALLNLMINTSYYSNITLLHAAIFYGQLEATQYLLEQGAKQYPFRVNENFEFQIRGMIYAYFSREVAEGILQNCKTASFGKHCGRMIGSPTMPLVLTPKPQPPSQPT